MQKVTPDNRYPGGKSLSGLPEWIAAQLPAHVYYAEPFAGKAGVFRHKVPAFRSFLIDQNTEVVDWLRRLKVPGCIVESGDGIRWCQLAAEWSPQNLLIYCDPPYLPETRSRRRLYRHEMTDADHERLIEALLRCRCSVAVSGYASELYDGAFQDWNRTTRRVITRGGTIAEEVLWTNRDPASSSVAMQYSEFGDNFRERDRINRKANRWCKALQKMPSRERKAVFLKLIQNMNESRGPHRHR